MQNDNLVVLRNLRSDDAYPLSEYANNRKIADNLRDRFPSPYSYSDAVSFLEMNEKEPKLKNFAIESQGEFVGLIGLILQDDIYRHTAEMGYWVAEIFWNKGIASRAVSLVIDYARKSSPLVRVYSSVFENNVGSQRVLLKNGFTLECIARKAVFKNGSLLDEYRYSYIFEEKSFL